MRGLQVTWEELSAGASMESRAPQMLLTSKLTNSFEGRKAGGRARCGAFGRSERIRTSDPLVPMPDRGLAEESSRRAQHCPPEALSTLISLEKVRIE